MNFERGKDIKESLDLGIRNYPHVVRAYYNNIKLGQVPLPLDSFEEYLNGEQNLSIDRIRITAVHPGDVIKMHQYWTSKEKGKLPAEDTLYFLEEIRGKKIIIRGKIYTVP